MEGKKILFNFLKSQRLMSIATTDGKKIFNTSVYYAIDKDFNLYFFSSPDTDHVQNIYKNNIVACSIADSHQKVTRKKTGIQYQGRAFELKDRYKILTGLKLWHAANPGKETLINLPNMLKKVVTGKIFQIKPVSVKFYNEALYPKDDFQVFTF